MFGFSYHFHSILWRKAPKIKEFIIRSRISLVSISMAGVLLQNHISLCDANHISLSHEKHYDTTSSNPVIVNHNDQKTALKKRYRALKWLEKKIKDLITIVLRAIYLFMAFSPAAVSSPLLLLCDEKCDKWWWKTLRDCVRRSGPCLTKFAQWIATRPDLFPLSLCQNLQDLQSKGYRHKWIETDKTLKDAFGDDYSDKLHIICDEAVKGERINGDYFSPVILGSGCVAQVLLGKLGDREVAVKVIHPGK